MAINNREKAKKRNQELLNHLLRIHNKQLQPEITTYQRMTQTLKDYFENRQPKKTFSK